MLLAAKPSIERCAIEPPHGRPIDPASTSARILKPRSRAHSTELSRAYELWSTVWSETFAQLEDRRALASDDFTRQDELLTIWHCDECIAMTAIRWVDLDHAYFLADSYFAAWPREALRAVQRDGTKICIPSYATIAKPWRHSDGCSLKDVLFALTTERFLASDAAVIVGTTRNDRHINEVCLRNGYVTIVKDVTFHNVSVDLMAFWRRTCSRPPAARTDEALVQQLILQLHLGGER